MFARSQRPLVKYYIITNMGNYLIGQQFRIKYALTRHYGIILFNVGIPRIYALLAPECRIGLQSVIQILSYRQSSLVKFAIPFHYGLHIRALFLILVIRLYRTVTAFLIQMAQYSAQLPKCYLVIYSPRPQFP